MTELEEQRHDSGELLDEESLAVLAILPPSRSSSRSP